MNGLIIFRFSLSVLRFVILGELQNWCPFPNFGKYRDFKPVSILSQFFCSLIPWRSLGETHSVKSVHIWSYSGPHSLRMLENVDQNYSEYRHFSCSEIEATTDHGDNILWVGGGWGVEGWEVVIIKGIKQFIWIF